MKKGKNVKSMSMSHGTFLGILTGLFLISKEIIVVNAETVVAVSTTLTFTILVKYAGAGFLASLDEEADKIEELFEQSRTLEKSMVAELKEYYGTQGALATEFAALETSLASQLGTWMGTHEAYFEGEWKSAMEAKLARLASLEAQAVDAFQSTFVSVFVEGAYEASWDSEADEEATFAELEEILGAGQYSTWSVDAEDGSADDVNGVDFAYDAAAAKEENSEFSASLVVAPAAYEYLGDAEKVSAAELNDPNYQVEFFYDADFYTGDWWQNHNWKKSDWNSEWDGSNGSAFNG